MTPSEKNGKNGAKSSRARVTQKRAVFKQTADLLAMIEDRDAAGAIRVLRAGLLATKTSWDGDSKSWATQEDWKERREAAALILAYKFGKPIERSIAATGNFEELGDLLNRIRESPLALKKLGDIMPDRAMPSETSESP